MDRGVRSGDSKLRLPSRVYLTFDVRIISAVAEANPRTIVPYHPDMPASLPVYKYKVSAIDL